MKLTPQKADLLVCSLLFIYAIVFILFHSPFEWYDGDSSDYIGSARSILTSHSYTFNFAPQTKFPPVYPLFLAILSALSKNGVGTNNTFVIGTALSGLIGVAVAYILIRKKSPVVALSISLLLLTSPFFFSQAIKTVASDLPYFTFSMLTLFSGKKLESQQKCISQIIWSVFFTFFLNLTLMTRSIGVTLLFAYCVYIFLPLAKRNFPQMFHRLRIYALPVSICILCELLWLYWSSKNRVIYYTGQYMDSYFTQIRLLDPHQYDAGLASVLDLMQRIIKNTILQLSHFSELFTHHNWLSRSPASPFVIIPGLLLSIAIFGQITKTFKMKIQTESIELPLLYFLFYMAMLLIWPFDEGQRFIMPVFPLLCWYAFEGFKILLFIQKNTPHRFNTLLFAGTLSAMTVAVLQMTIGHTEGVLHYAYLFFWITTTIFMAVKLFLHQHIPLNIAIANWYRKTVRKITAQNTTYYFRVCILSAIPILHYGMVQQYTIINNLHKYAPQTTALGAYVPAARWLKENVPANSIISATQPGLPHRISGLKVIPFPATLSNDIILSTLNKNGVQYLISIDEGKYPYFYPTDNERIQSIIKTKKVSLELVNSGDRYLIYKVYQ